MKNKICLSIALLLSLLTLGWLAPATAVSGTNFKILLRAEVGDNVIGATEFLDEQTGTKLTGDQNHVAIRDTAGNWIFDFAAPAGQNLTAGTSYTDATRHPFQADTVAGINVNGPNGSCTGITGKFSVQEANFDSSNKPISFAVNFEYQCAAGGPKGYGQIAVNSTATQPPLQPLLTLNVNKAKFNYKETATLTAHLSNDAPAGSRTVSVYATEYNGSKTLLQTGEVDTEGNLAVTYPMVRNTTFTAEYAANAGFEAKSGSAKPKVYAKTVADFGNYTATSGKYRLYKAGRRMINLKARVAPNHSGECIKYEIEIGFNGTWEAAEMSPCYRLNSYSKHKTGLIPANRIFVGIKIRSRVVWNTDNENLGSKSPWAYAAVVR